MEHIQILQPENNEVLIRGTFNNIIGAEAGNNFHNKMIETNAVANEGALGIDYMGTGVKYMKALDEYESGNNGFFQSLNDNEVGKPIEMARYHNQLYMGSQKNQIDGMGSFKQDNIVGKEIKVPYQDTEMKYIDSMGLSNVALPRTMNIDSEAKRLEIQAREKKGICGPSRDTSFIERSDIF